MRASARQSRFLPILGKSTSFCSQRLQRLNARGSSRRNVGGNQRNGAEEQTHARVDRRIRRCCAKQQRLDPFT